MPSRFAHQAASRALLLALSALATTPLLNAASGTYNNAVSGGLWSDSANWSAAAVADGSASIATFTATLAGNNTVNLDGPRTIGGLAFTGSTSFGWTLADNGSSSNILTLDNGASAPVLTTSIAGVVSTVSAPLVSTTGLTKLGNGTLSLTNATLSGALSVGNTSANTSILRLEGASTANLTTLDVNGANGVRNELRIAGATVTVSGLASSNGVATASRSGQIIIESGTVNLNGGWRTNADAGAALKILGGNVSIASVDVKRNGGTSADFTSGFVVSGGTAAVAGTVGVGTGNSYGAMSIEGGNTTVNGAVTVSNMSTAGRGGALRVTGGAFTSADTVDGIILGKTNGAVVNQVSSAAFSGGVSNVEKITFQYDSTLAGTGTLSVSGTGALYLGSGGIVKKDAATTQTIAVNLTAGTLGAKAGWTTALPISTGATATNNPTIKAADANDVAHDITLNGALGGAGAFTKTGAGTLTLGGVNTYTGATTAVNAGRLHIVGSLAANTTVSLANDALLSGTGVVNGAVTVADASSLAHAGILVAGDGLAAADDLVVGGNLSLGDNSILRFTLGAANAHSSLIRSGGTWSFDADQAFDFVNAQTGVYDNLISGLGGTETGLAGIAGWTSLAPGLTASFTYDGAGGIDLVLATATIPEPASLAALAGVAALGLAATRRRRRA